MFARHWRGQLRRIKAHARRNDDDIGNGCPDIHITEEILVRATLEKKFASLIAQMGRLNETRMASPAMVLETRRRALVPGACGENGHLWGFVQSIKRPTLLEILGPLFMSTAATSNLLYRLSEVDGGSLITFTHTLVGPFPRITARSWHGMERSSRARAQGRRSQHAENRGDCHDHHRHVALRSWKGVNHYAARAGACAPAHLSWKPHPKSMSLGQWRCMSPPYRATSPNSHPWTPSPSRLRS